MAPPDRRRLATFQDLLALPEDARAEIVHGEIVQKARPAPDHSLVQSVLVSILHRAFHRRAGGQAPGGWWILAECDIELEPHEIYTPDVAGWRRDRVPERPRERPVRVRPDWVCEVLSPSNARNDLVAKMLVYHRAGLPHYWIVDPDEEVLLVHRWQQSGFLLALTARHGDVVRAEPYEAIELKVGLLFGDEEEEDS